MATGLTGGCLRGSSTGGEMRSRSGTGSVDLSPSLPAGEVDRLHDRLRQVTRRHHQRHPQRELVTGLAHRLLVFDLHDHGFARPDIGDRVGEDVRPLLFDEARLLAGGLRLLVNLAGLLPLLDVAHDDALSDHHLQGVDRRSLRQRIDVDRLDPSVGRIVEDLGDAGPRGGAGDDEIDVGADQRRFDVAVVLALAAAARRSAFRLGSRRRARFSAPEPRHARAGTRREMPQLQRD